MPFNEVRAIGVFAKAIELGSIRKAALAQGTTPQAASHTIAQLERHLGVRLLHRTTRSLAATEEGRHLLEQALPALAALQGALGQVKEARHEIAGPIRIAGPKSSFAPVLTPVLEEFCRKHPAVQPDVRLDDAIGDWVLDRVDVGFRIGVHHPASGLIARRLFPLQLIVCASPAYLDRHGVPATPADLSAHRCSVFRNPVTGQVAPWYFTVDGAVEERHLRPAMSTNDLELELQLVLAGQAIGQLTNISAASHIRAGRLVPLLLPSISAQYGVYIYYGSRSAQPRRVRAFIDLAVARLHEPPAHVLAAKELEAAAQSRRRTQRKRR
ncbi:MAG: LysR family transcriptional regulator [Betaproteobacteria bacterium]